MTSDAWWTDAVFYHLYPLGFCGAPKDNDLRAAPVQRCARLAAWWDHIAGLGVNAVLFGPLLESSSHGYDTADLFHVDRRLGDWAGLREACAEARRRSMRIVLDGVFHHVGRQFWAFRDLRERGDKSAYRDWFSGVRFGAQSPYGDPFAYDGWEGHYDLVKLDLRNPSVREHLFAAVRHWIEQLDIDGLRLDVAYALDRDFVRELVAFCRGLKPSFWLMGEMIHGDYRTWVGPSGLDSGTNYECYKGLWSSHHDVNYFEIAYSLNRLFGGDGLYRELALYNFADNHDVSRVASQLKHRAHLYPLHILLFTIPGIPSIYYGSEWGIPGPKTSGGDWNLRPEIDLAHAASRSAEPNLANAIARLAALRHDCPALRHGDYTQLHVAHEQLAFARRWQGEDIVVAVNSASRPSAVEVPAPAPGRYVDLLNPGQHHDTAHGRLRIDPLNPTWGAVLRRVDR
jgi:glycosidase